MAASFDGRRKTITVSTSRGWFKWHRSITAIICDPALSTMKPTKRNKTRGKRKDEKREKMRICQRRGRSNSMWATWATWAPTLTPKCPGPVSYLIKGQLLRKTRCLHTWGIFCFWCLVWVYTVWGGERRCSWGRGLWDTFTSCLALKSTPASEASGLVKIPELMTAHQFCTAVAFPPHRSTSERSSGWNQIALLPWQRHQKPSFKLRIKSVMVTFQATCRVLVHMKQMKTLHNPFPKILKTNFYSNKSHVSKNQWT